ncbi:YkgJ family cysteine cluster protein, partial [Dissulfurirhabdus thermomarina]
MTRRHPGPADPPAGCRRCGACCTAGGPTLHLSDRDLVTGGHLRPEDLVTLRAGEIARDPRDGRLLHLPAEMIKVRGRAPGTWACRFYAPRHRSCRIYARRPLECRVLDCRRPAAAAGLFLQDLLSRRDLLAEAPAVLELVEAHDRAFPPKHLYAWAAAPGAAGRLAQAQETEARFRARAARRLGLSAEALDFVLGRPLDRLLEAAGILPGRQAPSPRPRE